MPLRGGSAERSERWSHKMAVKTVSLRLTMQGNTQIENITKSVVDALAGTGLSAGIVTVFIKHTTAAVMIIEDEPGIRADTKFSGIGPCRTILLGSTTRGMPVRTMATAT